MPEVSRRVQRFEKGVYQLSSEFLMTKLKIPLENFASISRVQVSADLRHAKVYVHLSGHPESIEQDIEGLQSEAKNLQRYIHSKLRSKFCPKVIFYNDTSYEKVLTVEKILYELSEQNKNEN